MFLCQWLILFHIFQCAIKKTNIHDQKYPAESSFKWTFDHCVAFESTCFITNLNSPALAFTNIPVESSFPTLKRKGAKLHLLGFFGLPMYWYLQTVLQRRVTRGSLGNSLKKGEQPGKRGDPSPPPPLDPPLMVNFT